MAGLSDILLLILGWLLGTLSPGIADAIGREKRRRGLLVVLAAELSELRLMVTLVLTLVRSKQRTMDQATLDLIRPILLAYQGEHPDDAQALDAHRQLLAKGDATYIALHNSPQPPGKALYPIPYDAPFLIAHVDDLGLFSPATQRNLLRVVSELRLFNEQVAIVQRAHERTFDASLSPQNYAANEGNLASGTGRLATRAEALIHGVNRLLDPKGDPTSDTK